MGEWMNIMTDVQLDYQSTYAAAGGEMKPLVIDLFSGTRSATKAFREAGYQVEAVEIDERFDAEHRADVSSWKWSGRRPLLIWASPPCTEFSRESMPWCRTGKKPSLDLVNSVLRIVKEADPVFWIIENVKGASRYLTPVLGKPLVLGPVFLWGHFPRPKVRIGFWKEKLSSKQRIERAMIPAALGSAILEAVRGDLFSLEALK